jgi:hypothetical protein
VQEEPAEALDPETLGLLASIGIEKGKPFAPDERMKKILTDAAAVGNVTARALTFRTRIKEAYYYPNSAWYSVLPGGGYDFLLQPGVRNLDARVLMHYYATGITPARSVKMVGVGSQYAADQEPGKIRDALQQLIQSQAPELAAAIRTGAQTRANQLKAQLASQVATSLTSQLNRSFSFYDDWFDPLIGLRGRFNLNKAFYLTAESDVGGFGIGSDIAVQAYAALGCQITRNIFSEVGYRYLYDDFRDTNFLYQLSLHGAQVTVGLTF